MQGSEPLSKSKHKFELILVNIRPSLSELVLVMIVLEYR